MKILIDNGHGENTPGKCSPDGRLKEWAYTREIADRVVAGLRHRGEEAERIVLTSSLRHPKCQSGQKVALATCARESEALYG